MAGLWTEAESGNRRAAYRLAEVLAAQDDMDGVTALATDSRTTSTGIRRILYDLLARLDQAETLRRWADRDRSRANSGRSRTRSPSHPELPRRSRAL